MVSGSDTAAAVHVVSNEFAKQQPLSFKNMHVQPEAAWPAQAIAFLEYNLQR